MAVCLRTLLADPAADPEDVSLLTPILTNPVAPAAILEEFIQRLFQEVDVCELRRRRPQAVRPPPTSRRAIRVQKYRQAQELYKNDREILAQRIIDGHDLNTLQTTPSLHEIQTAYDAIFSAQDAPLNLQIHDARP